MNVIIIISSVRAEALTSSHVRYIFVCLRSALYTDLRYEMGMKLARLGFEIHIIDILILLNNNVIYEHNVWSLTITQQHYFNVYLKNNLEDDTRDTLRHTGLELTPTLIPNVSLNLNPKLYPELKMNPLP